jgi:hypothetical protein
MKYLLRKIHERLERYCSYKVGREYHTKIPMKRVWIFKLVSRLEWRLRNYLYPQKSRK